MKETPEQSNEGYWVLLGTSNTQLLMLPTSIQHNTSAQWFWTFCLHIYTRKRTRNVKRQHKHSKWLTSFVSLKHGAQDALAKWTLTRILLLQTSTNLWPLSSWSGASSRKDGHSGFAWAKTDDAIGSGLQYYLVEEFKTDTLIVSFSSLQDVYRQFTALGAFDTKKKQPKTVYLKTFGVSGWIFFSCLLTQKPVSDCGRSDSCSIL